MLIYKSVEDLKTVPAAVGTWQKTSPDKMSGSFVLPPAVEQLLTVNRAQYLC